MPMHDWLAPKYPCAVLQVNCYRGGIVGSAYDLDKLLKTVDQLVASAIRFTHCPSLRMPTRIQTFSDLASLEVYNSSIASWASEAALTSSKHPFLGSLCLARVANIASLPAGLLDPNFPACDIVFSTTDLATLPHDLPDRWPRALSRILIEHSKFTVFPDALLKMGGLVMSFSGNDLAPVPGGALEGRRFAFLGLADNPRLAEISPSGWLASVVDLRRTNITSPPLWATQAATVLRFQSGPMKAPPMGLIFGGGSPMCAAYAPDAKIPLASGMALDCSLAPLGHPDSGMFPLDKITQQRQP